MLKFAGRRGFGRTPIEGVQLCDSLYVGFDRVRGELA